MDSIISICKKKNVKLFLISTPLRNKYLDKIPKLFYDEFLKQKMRMIALNQVVLDHTSEFNKDSLFYDGDHINFQGSVYFSKIINKSIKD